MGWAAGFQAGSRVAGDALDTYYTTKERAALERIQNAKADELEGYTPQTGELLQGIATARDAEGNLAYQLTPSEKGGYGLAVRNAEGGYTPVEGAGIQPQRVTEFLGQRYEGGLTPERQDTIRTRAMANAVSDPRLRQQMLLAATQEERAAQGFDTEQKLRGLQLNKLQRDEDTENKILKIDEQAGEFLNKRLTQKDGTTRAATPDDMIAQIQHRAALMQQGGLGREAINALKDWQGVAVNAIQLSTAQRNDDLGKVAVAVGAGNLGPARDFYDKYVLDGAKVTGMTTNKDGSISVSRVRDDGVKLPDTKIASTNALLATLNSFRDPMSLYNFSQNEFKNNLMVRELDIKQQTANTTQEYYKNRGAAEKMGSAQYFQGEDGNTYASIPVMGKEGLKFETVKVNPDDIKMKKAGAGANDNKPVKIEEEGTKMSIGGKTVIADGNGNWIPADGNGRPVGVLPSERTKFLKEAGVPDNLVGQLPWNKTGTALLFNGKAYDPKDPKDLKTMVDTYKRLGKADIAMQEGLASDLALQARARQRAGAQPSLYADPLDWQLYRNQERNLGLIPNLNQFPSSQEYP